MIMTAQLMTLEDVILQAFGILVLLMVLKVHSVALFGGITLLPPYLNKNVSTKI